MAPKAGDVLHQARELIEDRLHELDQERHKLEKALSELTGEVTGGRIGKRKPGRPKGSGRKPAGRKRAGRKPGRKKASRADQAVKMVAANPGITPAEMAKKMKIKPNYLYRVLSDLQKQGKVKKKGRGYHAA